MSSRPIASPAAGVLSDLRQRHREALLRAQAADAAAAAHTAPPAEEQVDWCSDAVLRTAMESEAGLELELDDDLSQFIASLTGSCDGTAPEAAAAAAAAAAADGMPQQQLGAPARESPPSVGAQPRLSFPSATALEVLHASAPPPRAATERIATAAADATAGGAAGGRLRRAHTFTGVLTLPLAAAAAAPAPRASAPGSARKKRPAEFEDAMDAAARSSGGGGSASFMQQLMGDDDAMDASDTPPPPARSGGVRRSASLPMPRAAPAAENTAERIAALLAGGGSAMSGARAAMFFDGSAASFGLLPDWSREREAGAPPLLTPAGLPTFAVPAAPGRGARPTSAFRGVSRAPWSTRWDAHAAGRPTAAAADAPPVYCGSFDSEERAARAHDLATLKLHGAMAGGPRCNFALDEYPGHEAFAAVPDHAFLDVLVASAFEPTERRYSKFRGVFRPRGAAKGAQQWEGRLEEAPASVAHHAHTLSSA